MLTFYQADKEEPWSYVWIGFDGTDAEECVKDLGISSERPIFQSRKGKELKRIVVKMIRTDMTSVSDQYKLQSLLYEFLALLMDHSIISNEDRESKESTYVNHAVSYIRNHYQEKIRVTDLALRYPVVFTIPGRFRKLSSSNMDSRHCSIENRDGVKKQKNCQI